MTAKEILENPEYLAISYGGYRARSRDVQPSVAQLKEDMRILHAMGIRIIRTYNVHLPHASNVLKAIKELSCEVTGFEMYVMLGAWIDCKNAWTDRPLNHLEESENNALEIERAVALARRYPDIVKIIAVGNEAMVKWATAYYVQPGIILKWVNYLQSLKKKGELPEDTWITSSDNFASWGGGSDEYHVRELNELIKSVDYISMHTYPMHDTHYNPSFWGVLPEETELSEAGKIDAVMKRAVSYAIQQYDSVVAYIRSLGINKSVHIGETGWASHSNGFYGKEGSLATDEYKEALFYWYLHEWAREKNISCFYFEAFDEPWKDSMNPEGSENHFGLFTVDGKAKFVLWDLVDTGTFKGLSRDGQPIAKTCKGDKAKMLLDVYVPPIREAISANH